MNVSTRSVKRKKVVIRECRVSLASCDIYTHINNVLDKALVLLYTSYFLNKEYAKLEWSISQYCKNSVGMLFGKIELAICLKSTFSMYV